MQSSEIELTRVLESEKPELAMHFKKYALELEWQSLVREGNASRFIDAVFKSQKRHIFWASSGGKRCGFGILTIEKGWPETSMNRGRISELYVFPEYRRKKIATYFVMKLKDFLKEQNCFEIEINVLEKNAPALSFWHTIGFKDTKRVMNLSLD